MCKISTVNSRYTLGQEIDINVMWHLIQSQKYLKLSKFSHLYGHMYLYLKVFVKSNKKYCSNCENKLKMIGRKELATFTEENKNTVCILGTVGQCLYKENRNKNELLVLPYQWNKPLGQNNYDSLTAY